MNQPLISIERKFRLEIEGLRVVAALLVAVYHIWFHRVSGGVDVFFVISGFLITSSIVSTINRTGEFRLWPYISKLMKRLYPALLFILGILVVLSFFLLPASIFDKTIREVIASMLYYQNWELALSNTDYLDASQMKTPVEHFWALSIQGQFYIIWFVLFTIILFILKKLQMLNAKILINIVLGSIFAGSLAYSIYLTSINQPWAYFDTFTRVWEFALGGLICVNLSSIKVNEVIAAIIGWLGLIGLILTGIIFDVSELFPGYIALWPMTCALFIILSGTKDTKYGVKQFLGLPMMVRLGGISFGIYLWHWVLLAFYRYNVQDTPGLIVGLLIIIVSILLAYGTTEFIEKPIRNSKNNRYSFKRLGVMGAINLVLIGVLIFSVFMEQQKSEQRVANKDYPGASAVFAQVAPPESEPIPPYSTAFDDLPIAHVDGSNQGLKESDLKIGEYGETEDYKKTIALIGSSHSEQWLGGILEATKSYDNYRVLNITRSGTRFSTGYEDEDLKGIWVNNVLNYLRVADIDLIISQGTASKSTYPKIHQQMIDQMQYVKDEYGIDVLVVRDNPRYSFNVLESLETKGVNETARLMDKEIDNQNDEGFWRDLEENNESLYKIDLTKYFKIGDAFQPIIGNVIIYRDDNHITNTYSESLGPVFEEKIDEIL